MITCSNCKSHFTSTLDEMRKGEVSCPHCYHKDLVTIHDMQKAYEKEEVSGFQAIGPEKEIVKELQFKEETDDSSRLLFHLNLLLVVFIILINIFTLGLIKLNNVKAFPAIEGFYKGLGIVSKESLIIEEVLWDAKNKIIKIAFNNLSGKRDILSQVKIIFYDLYSKEVGHLILEPLQIVKPGQETFLAKVNNLEPEIESFRIEINEEEISDKVTVKKE
jgi:hypothetical protein